MDQPGRELARLFLDAVREILLQPRSSHRPRRLRRACRLVLVVPLGGRQGQCKLGRVLTPMLLLGVLVAALLPLLLLLLFPRVVTHLPSP